MEKKRFKFFLKPYKSIFQESEGEITVSLYFHNVDDRNTFVDTYDGAALPPVGQRRANATN